MSKILIVDDEIQNIEVLKALLEDEDYQIGFLNKSEFLFKRLEVDKPDLLLLDINMPGKDGITLLKELKAHEEFKHIPVIMITGETNESVLAYSFNNGAADYINKPFKKLVLAARVRNAIEAIKDKSKVNETNAKLQQLNEALEERVVERTKALEQEMTYDRLTGLYNRYKLEQRINETCVTLILINVNEFSAINNAYGIEAGNQILIEMANRLIGVVGNKKNLFRIGGDEFVIFVDDVDKLQSTCDGALQALTKNSYTYDDADLFLQTTIGVVLEEEKNQLQKLDIARRQAKKLPMGIVHFYKQDYDEEKRYKSNLSWTRKVKVGLEYNQMRAFYQGIRDNREGLIYKYETLVRLVNEDGIISPFFFLESAKKAGLMVDTTLSLLRQSLENFKDNDFEFSVNLTEDEIRETRFIDSLMDLIDEFEFDPKRITFEVLEAISLENDKESNNFFKRLREKGFKIAIDDFGTAYSNFSRLFELQVDYIKIDGSFIKNIHQDVNSFKITKTITDLSNSIGAEIVAEYVHNDEVQKIVEDLGIQFSQGFLFSEPSPDIIPVKG